MNFWINGDNYIEDVVDSDLLPLATSEKGNLLGVMGKSSLGSSVFTL